MEQEEGISHSRMARVTRTEGQDGVMHAQGHSAISSFQPYGLLQSFFSVAYGTILIEFFIIII